MTTAATPTRSVTDASTDRDTSVATLANGVRVVTISLPHSASASVSVFVRTGSRNESARLNGVSHVVEHMAFKGTRSRDAHRINLDAEPCRTCGDCDSGTLRPM